MPTRRGFSTLQRVEIAEIPVRHLRPVVDLPFQYSSTSRNCRNATAVGTDRAWTWFQYSSTSRNCRNSRARTPMSVPARVSVLFNESKLPKFPRRSEKDGIIEVSVLFNESKLPKSLRISHCRSRYGSFSTLQRVEIAEMLNALLRLLPTVSFSTLQRVEIAEIEEGRDEAFDAFGFSTLQRVEIAEIMVGAADADRQRRFQYSSTSRNCRNRPAKTGGRTIPRFQYSSTSRNCRNGEGGNET